LRSGLEGHRLPLLGRLLEHDLDGLLDLRQARVAEASEVHPLLEEGELALEAPILALELGDDRLEPRHRLLERPILLHASVHDSPSGCWNGGRSSVLRLVSRTMALNVPWLSWTRTRSPKRTASADRIGRREPSRNATE